MSWFPDLARESMVAEGEHVRAIGWLASNRPYTRGPVPPEFVARLREFVELADASSDALGFGVFGGFHTCEFCRQNHDSRNFGVPAGELLYVPPAMIGHYVEQHGYAPPAEFIAAVAASPLPSTEEYARLAEPFARLNRLMRDYQDQGQVEDAGRWAAEQGGGEEAVRAAASRFFGHSALEICERIRAYILSVEPGAAADDGGG